MPRFHSGKQTPPRAPGLARQIVQAFDDYNSQFSDITHRAKRRFEQQDRQGMQQDTVERLYLYDQCLDDCIADLEERLAGRLLSRRLWQAVRICYARLLDGRLDEELYKTFFNSLTRRLFRIRGVDPALEFLALDIEPTDRITHPVARHHFSISDAPHQAFERALSCHHFRRPFAHLSESGHFLAQRLAQALASVAEKRALAMEFLETVFYRDGKAYLVGRIFAEYRFLPCLIELESHGGHIYAKDLITSRRDFSILFGYTHNYFLADLPTVGDAVVFLRTLLPHKPLDELYTVLGRIKQGKTERYRHFFRHLAVHQDQETLIPAAGTPGLVMVVFTLPSYPLVFKVIRDHFGPAKPFDRKQVIDRYRLVFRHERGGRLVDAQSYRNLRFPLASLDQSLREELETQCRDSIQRQADHLIIRHCFVERRVIPLNLFLSQAKVDEAGSVIQDYGQAITDLAQSNIFPGDLLLKNFGVTGSGRVVFYDYDEIRLLSECHFRPLPPPRCEEELFSDEPWYTVADGDVFPEQFHRFMGLSPDQLKQLKESHPGLFNVDWWRTQQKRAQEKTPGPQR